MQPTMQLFEERGDVRYVAVLRNGQLVQETRPARPGITVTESDRYEELLVNPVLLELAGRRGAIDCGGLEFLVVRYGKFFEVVVPAAWGHVSVAVEAGGDPLAVAAAIRRLFP